MKKIVIIPDSFKGNMSSMRVCEIISEQVKAHFPLCATVSIPVADGGEGTVDCFLASVGGEKVYVEANNPFFNKINSFYAILPDKKTAVIEVAAIIGLPLVENRKNPLTASTFGVGELVKHALSKGCSKIILGLGGSSTNDAGAGMAAALGAKFYNADGKEFIPTGSTLKNICKIDVSQLKKLTAGVAITAMCDVENPLFGKNGAAYIFGPQKGADAKTVEELDQNLRAMSDIMSKELGIDISTLNGGGSAGGLGAGIAAYFNGELYSGIDTILDNVNFDELIKDTDLIISGEGRIDSQSMQGKVISGVSRRAAKQNKPLIAIVGDIDSGAEKAYEHGVTSIISINKKAVPFGVASLTSELDLAFTADALMRTLKAFGV
jgi:glycerate kinase